MLNKLLVSFLFISFVVALSYATTIQAAVSDSYYKNPKSLKSSKKEININDDTDDDNFKGLKPKPSEISDADNSINTALIEAITGAKNNIWYKNQQVYKIFIPRNDLNVSIAGTRISPEMGLTSWVSFKSTGKDILAVGDLILHENQVNPVMDELLANNIKITGLQSQFLWDEPKVMIMHIEAQSDEKTIATGLARVFVKLRENYGSNENNRKKFFSKIKPNRSYLTEKTIDNVDKILGMKGFTSPDNQVYKIILGRTTKLHAEQIGQAMGVRSWAAFTGTDSETSVTGDLAVYESELQDVLAALRAANIQITGINQRMMGEKPRILYVHYWGSGYIEDLATGIRNALEKSGYTR